MFSYRFIQKPSFKISTDIVDSIFKNMSENIPAPQKGTLNIVFVSPEEIRKYNTEYRKKESITDVLSFHYYDDFSGLSQDDIAGELIFCEEKILSQAKEYGLGEEKEFYKLLIHSILHILGFDHEEDDEYEEMKRWEEIVWSEVGL